MCLQILYNKFSSSIERLPFLNAGILNDIVKWKLLIIVLLAVMSLLKMVLSVNGLSVMEMGMLTF